MDIKTPSINLITTVTDGGRETLRIGLKEAYRSRPQCTQYLRKEFARGKDLDSPHIFKYIDLRDDAANGVYISLEWEGCITLAQWLKEEHNAEEKKRVVRQVASAVDYMHGAGVVHGCLNTHNIFITSKGGNVKLLTVRLRYADMLSQPADMLKFLAPEAKDGTVGLDTRTDIYSLGMLVKEMGLGDEYGNVIARCCKFGRNERFATVDDFTDALERRRYTSSRDDAPTTSAGGAANKKMAVIIAVVAILAAVAVAVYMAKGSDDTAAQTEPAQTEQAASPEQGDAQAADTTVEQPAAGNAGPYTDDNAFLNELVPQMHTDLDKIYASGDDAATVRQRVGKYYKGLRRVLKKQGKNAAQLDAFDKAFAEYTQQKNQ